MSQKNPPFVTKESAQGFAFLMGHCEPMRAFAMASLGVNFGQFAEVDLAHLFRAVADQLDPDGAMSDADAVTAELLSRARGRGMQERGIPGPAHPLARCTT